MTPKIYELWPGRLWTRGRTNNLTLTDRRELAATAGGRLLTVSVCPRPDPTWTQIPGVTYWHRPMPDGKTIPPDVEALADQIIENDTPTLIYCNGGRNRSPFIAGLVLTRLGITGAQAAERIRTIRPGALANPLFYAYLQQTPAAHPTPDRIGPCIAGALR